MVGKFLKPGAIIDTKRSEAITNAIQKRSGLNHHVRVTSCGCPDPNCGAFHVILKDRPLPTRNEAEQTLAKDSQARKAAKRRSRPHPLPRPR